ncbi:MAG: hypothetical protein IKG85_11015 [Clostridia bacterium]|nr:hypothetical protein [Clostridia bacterium]
MLPKFRAIVITLLFASSLLTASFGCLPNGSSKTNDEVFYIVDYSMDTVQGVMQRIFGTEDSVYYLASDGPSGGRILFSDKQNKGWLPLCSKPNCTHDSPDCDSYIEGDAFGRIWLYGRHIYYIVTDDDGSGSLSLWRMKLDGGAHERLRGISAPEDHVYNGWRWTWSFHNKYAILSFSGDALDDEGKENIFYGWFVIDLGDRELKLRPLELIDDEGRPGSLGVPVAGKDRYLYSFSTENENEVLYRTDLETGEQKRIGVLPFAPMLHDCTLEGDSLIMCDGWDTGAIYEFSLVTGETRVLAQAEDRSRLWYRYYKGKVYGAHHGVEGAPFATGVYELDGTPIQIVDGSVYGKPIMMNYCVGDLAFGYDTDEGDNGNEPPRYYLDLTEVGTEAFTWRKWGE